MACCSGEIIPRSTLGSEGGRATRGATFPFERDECDMIAQTRSDESRVTDHRDAY